MSSASVVRSTVWLLLAATVAMADTPQTSKTLSRPVPVAVAPVRLLMDTINAPAFRGVDRVLRARPTDDRTWNLIAEQALLVAENGNLLLLRPPRGKHGGDWLDRATELRLRAVHLSEAATAHDYDATRKAMVALGGACSQCHKQFHIPIAVAAFKLQPIRPTNVSTAVPPPPAVPPVPQPPEPPRPPAVPQPPSPP